MSQINLQIQCYASQITVKIFGGIQQTNSKIQASNENIISRAWNSIKDK